MKKFTLLMSSVAMFALAAPAFAEDAAVTTEASTVTSEQILSEPVAEPAAAPADVSEPVATTTETVTETTTMPESGIEKTVTETTMEKTTVTEVPAEEGKKPMKEVVTETTKIKEVKPAAVVKTETLVTQKEIPNTNRVNLLDFDLDQDGVLTRAEVGEKLFYMFDTDGNMIIDNLEINRVGLVTLIPMEKTTVKMVDIGANGKVEEKVLDTEEFMAESRLIEYDQNRDGLTPLEFIGMPFNRLDKNNDKAVDVEEWKEAYASYVKPKFQRQSHYN
ncbi:MAG: hypothetical protein LRZ85_10135 [Alphaproteobacteria bacterium]|nr:hypothetical protein [Alphaproteobacteria bacterium]MCD8519940.1 hypothetical protein [Alphaproteobacteria bacterium]MCD8525699.1 hypothetical protein [Alphaproteobacteria bacterium]MCD8570689.1 hypothetical protein [Alphaproteobacteria bacterium]